NQTYQDIEIIIQDSNSTDQTESICKKYATIDPRIQYYREKDEGQSDAINRGLAKAKGDYWTWICSDDRYHANPDALKNLIQHFFEKHSESSKVVGVYGNAFFMNETGEILHEYGNFKKDLTVEHFIHNWPLSQPSSILLTKAVRQVNGVDKNLFLGMDLDLFIKILKNGNQFVFVDTPVVDIRLQDNSKSVKYRKDTALNALNLILSHFNTIGNYQESAYFKELFLTAETTEIRKFLSKLNWKFKWKYRVMNLLEKTSITQKLLHLLRKLRG
ncbi:MAG TPA: glycosyltransferase, partial [Leptospiraceae bacterium]|nr:glycosyltransferase [Leptospiraceae bacterium]